MLIFLDKFLTKSYFYGNARASSDPGLARSPGQPTFMT